MYKRQGFTMIELIVVIFIIGLIASAVFVSVKPAQRIRNAKDSQRWADLTALSKAIEKYTADYGSVPTDFSSSTLSEGEKVVLCNTVSDLTCDGQTRSCALVDDSDFLGKYLGVLPVDPDKLSTADTGYFMTRGAANSIVLGVCDNDLVPEISMTAGSKMEDLYLTLSLTQTSDADFSGGTLSVAMVSGSGDSAGVTLQSSEVGDQFITGDGPSGVAFDSFTNSIWVTNALDDTVSKFSAIDNSLIATYTVGNLPLGAEFDSITNSIWITNYLDNTVTKLDASTGAEAAGSPYDVGTGPKGLTLDIVNNAMWIGNQNSSNVTKLDASTGAEAAGSPYSVGANVYDLTYASSSDAIWAISRLSTGEVWKLNAADGSFVATSTVGSWPVSITFDPSTDSIWIGNSTNITKLDADTGVEAAGSPYSGSIFSPDYIVFDPSTNSIWTSNRTGDSISKFLASDGSLTGNYDTGSDPKGIVFDSYNNYIWVASYTGDYMMRFLPAAGSLVDVYDMGDVTDRLALDSSTNSVWVTHGGFTGTASKFSITNKSISGTYGTGGSVAYAITFDSSTNSIWVTNYNSDNIRKISAATGAEIDTYVVGDRPAGVIFEDFTNSIWVTNYGDDTITKFDASTGVEAAGSPYDVGNGPKGVVFDSVTNSIWVVNQLSNDITKLNASTGAEISGSPYSVGSTPERAAFDSSTNSIWVTNSASADITKLSAVNGNVLGTYDVNIYPLGITFDSSTNSIWVVHSNAFGIITQLSSVDGSTISKRGYGAAMSDIVFDSSTNSLWVSFLLGNIIKEFFIYEYSSSGIFTSSILDTTTNINFSTIDWAATLPSNTSITTKARTDTSSDMSGATDWSSCTTVTDGSSISSNSCVTDTDQYIQYQTTLSTTDATVTPTLDDMTINYVQG